MSESEEESEHFCYYGKPLEPYDEDAFPKKRPISVEDQIATDAQGRRRFHGAFTGGFSAGFFNTVGSSLGWTPTEFKSSRLDKAKNLVQKPEDFMDDEDIGEYGIAPQVIKATNDYNTNKKRKRQVFSDGPIPGEPVLHNFLTSGNETVGYMLLKNLRIGDKIKEQSELLSTETKQYGCEMPKPFEVCQDIQSKQYKIPEIYEKFLQVPKNNTFGLGYSGLNKNDFNEPPKQSDSKFVVTDRSNKKMSITGQAFGVGAFEEEDTDIYMKEDMSKYDFELSSEKKPEATSAISKTLEFDLFVKSKIPLLNKKLYPPPEIPYSFTGKHKIKRSRFEPIVEKDEETNTKINPMIRAKYLGEDVKEEYTESKPVCTANQKANETIDKKQQKKDDLKVFDAKSLYLNDRFVSSSEKEDIHNILEPVKKTECLHGTEQMRQAAKMKMFGPLTRITSDWVPHGLLCNRFNVPEPFVGQSQASRPRTKNLIFQSQTFTEKESNLKPGLSTQKTDCVETGQENNQAAIVEASRKEIPSETVTINTNISEQVTDKSQSEEINNSNETTTSNGNLAVSTTQKDITDKLDIAQNQDLFKAVFLSSDESEDENDDENRGEKQEESIESASKMERLKSLVLSDEFLPKIKNHKEGILSGVSFQKISMPNSSQVTEKSADVLPENKSDNDNAFAGLYGPKIPEKKEVIAVEAIKNTVADDTEDEWVEVDKLNKSNHKKLKKHKKNKKHKHKKSRRSQDK